MMMNPVYPVGNSNVTRLGAYSRNRLGVFYGDDYSGFTVQDDGYVYDATGAVDPNMTATFRQIEATQPGTITEAKTASFDWNSLVDNVTQLVQVGIQAEAQRDLLQMNLDRARQGLPPINAQQYMPGVNVGVSDDTKQLLYILGFGALGVFALSSVFGGRRGRRK
jgi:hypothetical protein